MIETKSCARWIGVAVAMLLASSSTAWAQTTINPFPVPGKPGVPTGQQQNDLKAMMQYSQKAQDYFAVVTRDAKRGQQYMQAVEADIQSFAPRFEALGFKADQSFNGQGPSVTVLTLKKDQRLAIEDVDSRFADLTKKFPAPFDPHTFDPSAHAKNGFYASALVASMRMSDEVERNLFLRMQESAIRLFVLYEQEARYKIASLQKQTNDHQKSLFERLDAKRRTFADAEVSAYWTFIQECRKLPVTQQIDCNYGERKSNELSTELEKKYATQVDPLCGQANEEDVVFLPQVASRLVPIGNGLIETHRRVLDDFRRVTDQIVADKDSRKAELGARNEQWLAKHKKLYSWGRVGEAVYVFQGFYDHPSTEMPSCDNWRQKMPQDLEAQFPMLSVGALAPVYNDRGVSLQLSFDKGPQRAALKIAQGGRWPEDGP